MLYNQLKQVNEIDGKVNDLHSQLVHLYTERAKLLELDPPSTGETIAQPVTTAPTPHTPFAAYIRLKQQWEKCDVTMPAFSSLRTKLKKACGIMEGFEKGNPKLAGKLTLVAVPPYKLLQKLTDLIPHRPFSFTDPEIFKNIKKTNAWSFMVVVDPEFSMKVDDAQDFEHSSELTDKGYDCNGLGIQELIAAEMQGVDLLQRDGWTLLLKDMRDDRHVPCVTANQDNLVFAVDDASCLLGSNFIQPAVLAC